MTAETFAPGTGFIDLLHGGRRNVIAASFVELDGGLAIIDPGPTVTLNTLWEGMAATGYERDDLTHVLLTHIHLDHAGGTGHLVRDLPTLRVVVHEKGAPHLIDPSRLMASARRLFGDRMDRLWGPSLPIPEGNLDVHPGNAGDQLDGGRIEIMYTPGHASHHMAYLDTKTGVAFVGDAAGGRIRNGATILPATPPPDIDIDVMIRSFRRIAERDPEQMLVTHFGPATHLREHGDELETRVHAWADRVRRALRQPGDDAGRAAAFALDVGKELRETLDEPLASACEAGAPPNLSWYGLARYWRKRDEAEANGVG